MGKKMNISDYMLIVLIVSIVFGAYGDAMQLPRVLAVLLLPFTLRDMLSRESRKVLRFPAYVLGGWILYAIISVLWTSNFSQAFKEVHYYMIHILLFFTVVMLARKSMSPMKSIAVGWTIFFLLTVPVALMELFFDIHLSNSIYAEGLVMNFVSKKFSSVTFCNLNTYVTVTSMAIPFVLMIYVWCDSWKKKVCFWMMVGLLTLIVFMNGSRGGLLTLGMAMVVFMIVAMKQRRMQKIEIGLLVFGIVVGGLLFFDIATQTIHSRMGDGNALVDWLFTDGDRMMILRNCWQVLEDSYGMGSGIGSLTTELQRVSVEDVPNAHNMWMEVLAQYGIIVFVAFVILLGYIFKQLVGSQNKDLRLFGLVAVAGILPMTVIDSGYLLSPWLWMYMGSGYALVKTAE